MEDKTDRRENVFGETRDNRNEQELYMEIQLPPEDHARLADIAQKTGRPESEIVRDVMGTYLDGMDEVRELLDGRLEDIESGRVRPVTAEQLWENLERRKRVFLQQRP